MRRIVLVALFCALGCVRDPGPVTFTPQASADPGASGGGAASDGGAGDNGTASARAPGCEKAARSGVHALEHVMALGKKRSYMLVVPERYDRARPYPVVFGLHGHGGSAASARAQLDLERHANGDAIFVYPQGVNGGWDLDSDSAKNRDVALFDAVLLKLHDSLCVDERRVFVTGFSNGAYMANQLACRRGNRIRGIAVHAGGGPYEAVGTYDDRGQLVCPGKAVASLVVHGLGDRTVAPTEGQKSIDHWSNANRCTGGSTRGSAPECTSMSGCFQPVVACKVPKLGHAMWAEGKKLTWSFFASLR